MSVFFMWLLGDSELQGWLRLCLSRPPVSTGSEPAALRMKGTEWLRVLGTRY